MWELLRSGDLEKHIAEVLIPAYQRRCQVLREAIERVLVGKGVGVGETSVMGLDGKGEGEGVFGGYFIWITLPEGMNAEYVAVKAKEEEGLIIAPGKIFEVSGEEGKGGGFGFERAVRLCFSWELEEDLNEGIERLGRVIDGVRAEVGSGSGRGKVDLANFR